MSANRHRGEIEAVLDGRRRTLCLTLGALAELEAAFGAENLAELAARFSAGGLTGRDLIALVAVGLRGGGHALTDAEVAALPLDGLDALVAALASMLEAAFGGGPENPTPPQEA